MFINSVLCTVLSTGYQRKYNIGTGLQPLYVGDELSDLHFADKLHKLLFMIKEKIVLVLIRCRIVSLHQCFPYPKFD